MRAEGRRPQHSTAPSLRKPQEKRLPAASPANCPARGVGLAAVVGTPAFDGAFDPDPAAVLLAGRYCTERAGGRIQPGYEAPAPAFDVAVDPYPRRSGPSRWTPTRKGPRAGRSAPNGWRPSNRACRRCAPTRVAATGVDRAESTVGAASGEAAAPALHGAIGAQAARLVAARRDRQELPGGASVWPQWLSPQHRTPPPSRNTQVCPKPAATAKKCPPGAVVVSVLALPQHWMSPSTRTAHEWLSPTVMSTYWPLGARSKSRKSNPQHSMVSSTRNPQVCLRPAERAVKVPPRASIWSLLLAPQHTTVPSVRRAQVWRLPRPRRNTGRCQDAPASPTRRRNRLRRRPAQPLRLLRGRLDPAPRCWFPSTRPLSARAPPRCTLPSAASHVDRSRRRRRGQSGIAQRIVSREAPRCWRSTSRRRCPRSR